MVNDKGLRVLVFSAEGHERASNVAMVYLALFKHVHGKLMENQ